MNKSIIFGVAGFVLGAVSGYFFTKKSLEGYYEERYQNDVAESKEFYEKRLDELSQRYTKDVVVETSFRTNKSSLTRQPEGNLYEAAKRNYNLISQQPDEPEPPEEEDADEAEDGLGGEITVDRTQPYVISDEEFSNEFPHHDKLSLYYYLLDGILTEENEEPIEDILQVIGPVDEEDLPPTFWVRNERLATDYEVIVLNSSYSDAVNSGMISYEGLSPRERYLRQKEKEEHEER